MATAWPIPAASTPRWVAKRRPIRPVASTPWPWGKSSRAARRPSALGHVDEDDVGFSRAHAQPLDAAQPLGQALRVGVVLGQAIDVVIQRVQCAGRQQTRLAQATAGHLADAPRALDQLARAAQG